nr:TrmH family RNA methyltransferase [Streptomyces sp. wa22]
MVDDVLEHRHPPYDPRLGDYTGLTDVELRRRREPAEGLFIAEGEKVIRRAANAGYEMRSMLLSAKWTDVMRDVIEEATAPVYAVTPALAERVTGYHVHRGALASMQRKPLPDVGALLSPETGNVRRVAVFEDIVDHANLGAAFRNAAALGVDAVLLTPRCADPLYRRAVKVSMGSVFHVPWAITCTVGHSPPCSASRSPTSERCCPRRRGTYGGWRVSLRAARLRAARPVPGRRPRRRRRR